MCENISVSLSGVAHSLLLFETSRCKFGQEGFLLGSIHEHEKHSVTDDQDKKVEISRIIYINAAIPCPVLGYFYNNIGEIYEHKLRSFLGSQGCKVIAWYRCSPLYDSLTFREKQIHMGLANFFKIPHDLFSVCTLTKEVVAKDAVLSFKQKFRRFMFNKCNFLPVHIMNLENKSYTYNKNSYTNQSFQKLLDNFIPSDNRSIAYVTQIQKPIEEHLFKLAKELSVEEEKLFDLEEEVNNLLHMKRMKENQIDIDDEIDYDLSGSPCEIVPFVTRLIKDRCTARKLKF